jgi:hypothetical protein
MLANLMILLILAGILTGAVVKIRSDRKKGIKCTGCSHCRSCSGQDRDQSGC